VVSNHLDDLHVQGSSLPVRSSTRVSKDRVSLAQNYRHPQVHNTHAYKLNRTKEQQESYEVTKSQLEDQTEDLLEAK